MSQSVRVLIAEDEHVLRAHLSKKIENLWPEAEIVAEVADGHAATEAITKVKPAVAFLDIHMPEMTGLEVARAAAGECHIVFVTAYDQYAIEAFDKGAVDYLVKPVNDDRLLKTIERVRARLAEAPADLSGLVGEIKRQLAANGAVPRMQWIKASVGNALKLVAISDVIFFQADEKYTRVVTNEGEVLIRTALRELIDDLDANVFWQIHRGTIVNVRAIDKVTRDFRGDATVHMKGNLEQLKVSRTFSHLFKQM